MAKKRAKTKLPEMNKRESRRRKDFFLNALGLGLLALLAGCGLILRLAIGVHPSALDYAVLLGTPGGRGPEDH